MTRSTMTDQMNISIDKYTENFVKWDRLSDKDRNFFIGDEYLPLHENVSERISVLKDISAVKLSEDALVNTPIKSKDDSTHEKYNKTENAWGYDVESGKIREWLYKLSIPFSQTVYLLYDNRRIVKTDWKVFITYWDAFSWSVGTALLVIDQTKQWVLEVHHEDVISFYSYNCKGITSL